MSTSTFGAQFSCVTMEGSARAESGARCDPTQAAVSGRSSLHTLQNMGAAAAAASAIAAAMAVGRI